MTIRIYQTSFWTLFVITLFLFFTPLEVQSPPGAGWDKLVHIFLFLALTILALRAFPRDKLPVILMLLFYTVVIEIVQKEFIPHRSYDPLDIVAGDIGLVCALIYSNLSS